ncbi:MAG: KEOPS complex subunit Pcc1 [Candidatus Hadarchaeia archaeon]
MVEAQEASSDIRLFFGNTRTAEVVERSLKPEELLPKASRAEVEINRRENILSFDIDARDTAALRAAINSFLRWAAIARDMTKV